jgi:glycosyltransferase involved in cell wall biosynthesis
VEHLLYISAAHTPGNEHYIDAMRGGNPMSSEPPDHLRRSTELSATTIRRLRVLQVIDSLPLGGAEQLLVTLASHIDATRFDLQVCSIAPLEESSPVVRDLRALKIPLHALTRDGERRHSPRHVFRLAGLVRRLGIDVLHTHLGYGNSVGSIAGALVHRPVVSTLHNAYFTPTRIGRLKQEARSQVLRWFAHTIIACAPEVRQAALTQFRLPAGKLVDVPNGIDVAAYAGTDSRAKACRDAFLKGATGPLVIAVGNLRPAKGHEYLVDGTARLRRRFPGLRVVIVGRGGEHETALRARIIALNLDNCVELAGVRRDVAPILQAADLFVQPSVTEGLPPALLEAMAACVPVVVTAVGGMPRLVEGGVTGRLVPPADSVALADAMGDMLNDPDRAARMAAAAQERIRHLYGARPWAQRLERIYAAASKCPWSRPR